MLQLRACVKTVEARLLQSNPIPFQAMQYQAIVSRRRVTIISHVPLMEASLSAELQSSMCAEWIGT